ncbi:hypothetical protein MQE36_13785 [Zhouia spongiae]|uniref:Uncharacterized protein n=1 Tax=Zhouia spongiae TaxID=2202721 RepID=A0ABY3YKY0_9FLAO|nr:hypothetical protein [Zhouia spongiae]UNY98151.1 hypothetical protein MQE36_13785 [Zhouia spongiae]
MDLRKLFNLTYNLNRVNIDRFLSNHLFTADEDYKFIYNSAIHSDQKKTSLNGDQYLKEVIKISEVLKRKKVGVSGDFKNRLPINKFLNFGIVLLLIMLPFVRYAYTFIPPGIKSYSIGFVKLSNFGFQDAHALMYFLAGKIYILIGLSIWYITSRHWWKFSILVPVSVTIIQIIDILNSDKTTMDEQGFWELFPYILPILLFLTFLSNKFRYFSLANDLAERLDNEINSLLKEINSSKNGSIKEQLELLKANRSRMTKGEYLSKLNELKGRI